MLPANAAAAFTAIMWTLGGDEATLGTSSGGLGVFDPGRMPS